MPQSRDRRRTPRPSWRVLVTGAAGGIGTALATRLRSAGHEVVALDLPGRVPRTSARNEPEDHWVACDITDEEDVARAVSDVRGLLDEVDVLVHAAGVTGLGRFEDISGEIHERVLAVNYLGPVHLTRALLPSLRRTGGRIVVLSSVAGFAPVPGRPPYVAAKHAVTGLFESLRAELEPEIGITLVHPTFVATGMEQRAYRTEGVGRTTTGGMLTADEVAAAIEDALLRGRSRVLLGRTARAAWWLWRLAPGVYQRVVRRRLTGTD